MRSLDGCRLHLKLPTTSDSTRTERRSRTPLPPPGSRRHCPLHRPTAMGDNSAADAPVPGRFGRICVFCGSNPGNRAVFGDAALDLGKELVMRRPMARQRPQAPPPLPPTPPGRFEISILGSISLLASVLAHARRGRIPRVLFSLQVARGIDLVYGGGSVGLMGLIAQTVLDGGCSVLGYLLYLLHLENSGSVQFSNTGILHVRICNLYLTCCCYV